MSVIDDTRTWYGHLSRGRLAEAAELMHEDVVLYEAASLPFDGEVNAEGMREVRGRDNFLTWVATSGPGQWKGFGYRMNEVLPVGTGGDRVVTLINLFGTRHDGVPFNIPVAEFSWWEDGRIVKVMPYYFDTAALLPEHTPA
jgi:hypothetical protein